MNSQERLQLFPVPETLRSMQLKKHISWVQSLLLPQIPTGWIYDPEGVDLEALKEIKEVKRARLSEYTKYRPNAEYHEGKGVWSVKADIALPCATQNELQLEDAKALVAMV